MHSKWRETREKLVIDYKRKRKMVIFLIDTLKQALIYRFKSFHLGKKKSAVKNDVFDCNPGKSCSIELEHDK